VHKACQLLALGQLDFSSIDIRIMGYVLAYQKFLDETGFVPEELEAARHHPLLDYCGTLDAIGQHRKLGRFLYDIKTGGPLRYHALQTAAYAGFFEHAAPRRATLFLQNDASYYLKFHDDRADWPNWVSCLNVMRLKQAA
jgi:hypothetical protein